jgi:hypothetical protein
MYWGIRIPASGVRSNDRRTGEISSIRRCCTLMIEYFFSCEFTVNNCIKKSYGTFRINREGRKALEECSNSICEELGVRKEDLIIISFNKLK